MPSSLAPTTGTISDAAIAGYAYRAGFRGGALVIAVAVALAESGGQVNALNTNTDGSTDTGLWQINSVHKQYDHLRLLDPAYNAAAAYAISAGGNVWFAWTTYTTRAYVKFLPRAQAAAAQATGKPGQAPDVLNGYTDASGTYHPPVDAGQAVPQGITGGLATGVAGAVASPLEALGSLATWLGNAHNWTRVVEVIGGGVAVLLALRMLSDVGGPVGAVAGGISKATAKAGKVAGTAALI